MLYGVHRSLAHVYLYSQPTAHGTYTLVPSTQSHVCQIIIHSYNMYTFMSKCIQEDRKCGNQCFTLTCCHLSNLPLCKQLHRKAVHHNGSFPGNFITTGYPSVLINCLITLNSYKIVTGSQISVKFSSSNNNFIILCKPSCCIFHY